MDLLLDTHIWLWSVLEPRRLSSRVARALTSPDNRLWLSSISVWELVLLHRKGRIEMDQDIGAWVSQTLELLQLNEAPLTIEAVMEVPALHLSHGNPADRFLVATAKALGLTLVTEDARLLRCGDIAVLSNS
jgi:PIN domain nuclease of toxin-antitoxin system